ncbi:MAG: hypothetical protein GXC72_00910 [Chitinophagaceae bacterium]|nr:hypothetical protein [Chitinophagaceae bacterium]
MQTKTQSTMEIILGRRTVFLVLSLTILCSCGIVNKSKQRTYSSVDSSATHVTRSTADQVQDSANKKAYEQATENTVADESIGRVEVEFGQDSVKPTGPVVISRDSSGNMVIDPGGRPVKKVTDTRSAQKSATTTTKNTGLDSTRVSKIQTTQKVDSLASALKKEVRSAEKKVFRWQVPWYAWLILPVIGLIAWRYRLYQRKIDTATKIPYSSPNDNTA